MRSRRGAAAPPGRATKGVSGISGESFSVAIVRGTTIRDFMSANASFMTERASSTESTDDFVML
jgi:hypothetical protein